MVSEAKKQALLALFASIEELKAMLDMVEGKSGLVTDGGEGSGNFNHKGRPGEVGGSSKSGSGGGYLSNPDRKRTSVNPNPYAEEDIDDADTSDETAADLEHYRSTRVNRLIGAGALESTHIALSISDYCNLHSYDIRHKSTPEFAKKNELVERYLSEAPLWDGPIYKGKRMKPEKVLEILERGEMSMPMIESWTEDTKVAMVFAVKGKGERVLFQVEKPKSAVPIAYYSDSYREKEILMPSDRKYKVRGSHYDGVFYYISLEEVNAPAQRKKASDSGVFSMSVDGGEGSGNFGHAGRVGKVGGSAPGEGASATKSKPREKTKVNLGMDVLEFYSLKEEKRVRLREERVMSDIGCDVEKAKKIINASKYYGGAFSYNIRHREEGIYNEYADTLSEYIENAPVLDVPIFKGKSLSKKRYDEIIQAGEFEFPMIESWSESSAIAGAFTDYRDDKTDVPVLFRLENNQSAVGTAMITAPREREVLSPEGVRYRVIKAQKMLTTVWVDVEEIGRTPRKKASDSLPSSLMIDGGEGSGKAQTG